MNGCCCVTLHPMSHILEEGTLSKYRHFRFLLTSETVLQVTWAQGVRWGETFHAFTCLLLFSSRTSRQTGPAITPVPFLWWQISPPQPETKSSGLQLQHKQRRERQRQAHMWTLHFQGTVCSANNTGVTRGEDGEQGRSVVYFFSSHGVWTEIKLMFLMSFQYCISFSRWIGLNVIWWQTTGLLRDLSFRITSMYVTSVFFYKRQYMAEITKLITVTNTNTRRCVLIWWVFSPQLLYTWRDKQYSDS